MFSGWDLAPCCILLPYRPLTKGTQMDPLRGISDAFMPHGMCYLWQPGLLWTHVLSDALIALAYFAIPATLAYSVYQGRQVLEGSDRSPIERGAAYGWMFIAFGVFIFACGMTHVLGIWNVWRPDYWLSGGVKVVTAIASVGTAVALPPLVPRALRLLRDARVSEGRRQALERSAEALRQAQSLAGLGSLEWDPVGDGVRISDEMAALYGMDPDRRPETLSDLMNDWVLPDERSELARALAAVQDSSASFEIRVDTTSGPRTLHTTAGRREDGIVLITQVDVTEARSAAEERRLRLEEARARARAEAEQARLTERNEQLAKLMETLQLRNEELDRFAYVASHDLKAPLRGIANLATFLQRELDGRETPRSDEFLTLMRGRVQRMEMMVDGLLEYSRVGRMREAVEEVHLDSFIREISDLLSPPDHISVRIDAEPKSFPAESVRLQQVLQNLIGNAFRYAETTVAITSRLDGNGLIEFSVTDDGEGIDEKYHEKIWEIFQRLDVEEGREGTGIGLALVRKITREQGGGAWIEPGTAGGADFRFTWPVEPNGEAS